MRCHYPLHFGLFLFLGCCCLSVSPSFQVQYTLGISLQPNWQEPITFASIGLYGNEIISVNFLTANEFVLIASGNMRDKSNPLKKNFFEVYGIPQCEVQYHKTTHLFSANCHVIDQLWKLRYAIRPGSTPQENTVKDGTCSNCGWAHFESGPDANQVAFLEQMGISVNEWVLGEQAFNLIRATTDPAFISAYQKQ